MEAKRTIGKRIKIARIESDKSQEWLAELFGVSQKTISAWESGRNPIDSARLHEIAGALGKPVAYFFEPFGVVHTVAERREKYETGGQAKGQPPRPKAHGEKKRAA